MMKSSLLATATSLFAHAQTSFEMGVVDEPSWDQTDHANNEYMWNLKFNSNNEFKIAVLSDLFANGSAEDYLRTQSLIEEIIHSARPDLLVILGDTVDPRHFYQFEKLYKDTMEFIKNSGTPWVWSGGQQVNGLTREQMLRIDQELDFSKSWSGYKWDIYEKHSLYSEGELGWFTSRVPIMDKTGKNEQLSVYMFDTDDWACSDGINLPGANCIGSNAISWFASQQVEWAHRQKYRDLLFMHRPAQEFMQMANNYPVYGNKEQAINCQAVNTGIFATALTHKRTGFITAGGDSGNDYAADFHGMKMCYARKTGSGGDGDLTIGARIFQLNLDEKNKVTIQTYIVDENGIEHDGKVKAPPSFSWGHQTQCNVDPYAKMFA